MTKKDYILIAKAMNHEYVHSNRTGQAVLYALALALCDAFIDDNIRFNKTMFMAAVAKKDA